jgi:hypothetical protein
VIGKLKLYAVAVVLGMLGVFGLIRKGRSIERDKRMADRLKAMQEKSKIEKDVNNADRDSVIDINTRP